MEWTEEHVRRLFWRAGFGATPEEAARWAAAGQEATLRWVLDGTPGEAMRGPEPTVDGAPLDPVNVWGHDVLWWIDRMVRTPRPLEEKLTLFWHDHFATADQDTPLLLAQNATLRKHCMGRFRLLLGRVTRDPAMQLFLSLTDNHKDAPNENFARELMELFTLGGGHSERDVREAARALTGWRSDWTGSTPRTFFDPKAHDRGVKRVLGRRGRLRADDVLDIVTAHPRHAPYITRKLWDFFVTRAPDAATAKALAQTYRRTRGQIKPVVEQILRHPLLYADLDAPDMVKSPVVLVAGALRSTGRTVTDDSYAWRLGHMGQTPFRPPSVAGWEWGPSWLSSGTMSARWDFANHLLDAERGPLAVADGIGDFALTPAQQVDAALDAVGRPWISRATREVLEDLAGGFFSDLVKSWQLRQRPQRADMLQRVLRHLILCGPDAHLH